MSNQSESVKAAAVGIENVDATDEASADALVGSGVVTEPKDS